MMLDVLQSLVTLSCVLCSLPFFAAGTLGVLRFPDVATRLHAVAKADTVGAGFVVLGVAAWWAGEPILLVKILGVWILLVLSSACVSGALINVVDRARRDVSDD